MADDTPFGVTVQPVAGDNRATAHLGPQDLGHLGVERVLHRVTLIGEIPVGPDGRESEPVEGTRFVSQPVFASAGSS
jgi:alpha-ketoglutarate-dependent sulfate ester dioxygenase